MTLTNLIKVEAKARKRHQETNTPEMDVTLLKSMAAQIKNQDIDLGMTKEALYRYDVII